MKFLQQIPFAGSANLGSHPKVQKAIENENKSHIAIFLGQHQFHPGHFFLVSGSEFRSQFQGDPEDAKLFWCYNLFVVLRFESLLVYKEMKERGYAYDVRGYAYIIDSDFLDSSWIEMGFPMGFLILGAGVSIFYFVPQLLLQGKCYTIDASSSSNFPFSHLFNFFLLNIPTCSIEP